MVLTGGHWDGNDGSDFVVLMMDRSANSPVIMRGEDGGGGSVDHNLQHQSGCIPVNALFTIDTATLMPYCALA